MQTDMPSATASPQSADWPSARMGWFAVFVLALAYLLSYADRMIISIVSDLIKADLQISDSQFGLLTGLAFGVFYTIMALPLGRLADSGNRKFIVAGGLAFFSLFSFFSGLAKQFWTLFLMRVGVGVGEASLTPAAYSMISDYFPPEKLARAMSVFTMSAFIGIGFTYMFGGPLVGWLVSIGPQTWPLVGEIQPWQAAFMLVALPGFFIVPLLLLVREPLRRGIAGVAEDTVPIRTVMREAWDRRGILLPIFAGFSAVTFSGYASAVWTPALFYRAFDWGPADVWAYGAIYLAFGPLGAITGGWLTDRLTAKGMLNAPLKVTAWCYLGAGLFGGLAPLMPDPWLALAMFGPAIFCSCIPYPLAGTAIQMVCPNRIRGQLSALYMLVINVVGLGLGPLVIGLLNDHVFTGVGDIRISLALVNAACAPLCFIFLAMGFKAYRRKRAEMLAAA